MRLGDELERFKTQINLAEYAEAQGYEIDRRESSRASTVMRRGDDKIIVATDQDGHGIYFSVRDDSDNGSIIDFVQKRQALNLGQVRRELRPWVSGTAPAVRREAQNRPKKPDTSSADRARVLASWMRMQAARRHEYLEQQRGISADTLADPRFVSVVRVDARGNAVFPHYARDELTGYEIKNDGFTGFASGGEKANWRTTNIGRARVIVICESAIDAMSHAQLFNTGDETAYVSVGGALNRLQIEIIQQIGVEAERDGTEIVIATDADAAGHRLAEQIDALIPDGVRVRRKEPPAKDWNDALIEQIEHGYAGIK